jgi:DNA primase catalytic core
MRSRYTVFSEQLIEDVRSRTSLVELISERVAVKQAGRNYQACCPFHTEKTPSFQINEEEGLYYCFGCGKKGNTFTFVMETKSLTFPEAVRFLAQKAGVALPISDNISENESNFIKDKELLRKIISEVALKYEEDFWNSSPEIKSFLEKRRISEYTAKRFRIGYAKGNNGSQRFAEEIHSRIKSSVKISVQEVFDSLFKLGLLRKRNSGQIGELFWDRIVFPITKSDLSPIGFGGRVIVDVEGSPKYINSPESPIYEKRKSFYGLGQGYGPAQKLKNVFIVEGYLDVISFSQAGLDNTLAVCGTALTEDHVKLLKRFVNKVYLVFDGDGAGRAAAARAFPIFLDSSVEVVPIILPPSEDPDSLTLNREESEIREILRERETSLLKLYLELSAGSIRGLQRGESVELSDLNASEAGKLSEEFAKVISKIRNPVELEIRIREASTLLGVTETAISKLSKDYIKPDKQVIHVVPVDSPPPVLETKVVQSESRRMAILKKQLMVSLLVEPSILHSSSIRSQVALIGVEDPRLNLLTSKLIISNADKTNDTQEEVSVVSGISNLYIVTPEEKEEILARFHGILIECSLEKEGLLEEALKQISFGQDSQISDTYRKLVEEFSQIADRVRISDELDELRIKEIDEVDVDNRMKLAQEKLLRKRTLSKSSK